MVVISELTLEGKRDMDSRDTAERRLVRKVERIGHEQFFSFHICPFR
jgi:hypothetical protein